MPKVSQGFAEKRKPAYIALIVCVVFAIVVMGPAKLSALRADAVRVFKTGVYEGATLSLRGDLLQAAQEAQKLANSAAASLGEADEGVKALNALTSEIQSNQEDAAAMLKAFWELAARADALYVKLSGSDPAPEILRDATARLASVSSVANLVPKDPFFTYADKFNEARAGFPARLLAWINGIDELATGR